MQRHEPALADNRPRDQLKHPPLINFMEKNACDTTANDVNRADNSNGTPLVRSNGMTPRIIMRHLTNDH